MNISATKIGTRGVLGPWIDLVEDMNSQYLKKEKVTTDQYFLLVELTHTQLCLVVVLKFSPIRAQAMGIHVLYKICPWVVTTDE